MVIANDHYQSIGIVCLSVISVSGRLALIELCERPDKQAYSPQYFAPPPAGEGRQSNYSCYEQTKNKIPGMLECVYIFQ